MQRPATIEEAATWHGNIGVVCGQVSGGLVCIDFDIKNGDKWDEWVFIANNIVPEVLSKVYMERTPSGGYHVCYRAKGEMRNRKLACNTEGKATIETRGEGGYFVCAPSKGYTVFFGKLSELHQLTDGEETTLLATCEAYDEQVRTEYKPKHNAEVTGDSVFNRYDSVTDPVPLLVSHGWHVVFSRGDKVYLRRPDKNGGISATWNVIPNRFYCFSTSTQFESEHVYKASAVYAILEHGGNFKAACKQLAQDGWGDKGVNR